MSPEGGGQTRITTDATADEFDPARSIDGNYIAFTAIKDGIADIHVVDVNDLSVKKLTDSPANEVKPSWGHIELLGLETPTPGPD